MEMVSKKDILEEILRIVNKDSEPSSGLDGEVIYDASKFGNVSLSPIKPVKSPDTPNGAYVSVISSSESPPL